MASRFTTSGMQKRYNKTVVMTSEWQKFKKRKTLKMSRKAKKVFVASSSHKICEKSENKNGKQFS